MTRFCVIAGLAAACALELSAAATIDTCRSLYYHGKLAESDACFAANMHDPNPFVRAQAAFGRGSYDEANEEFKIAVQQQPKSAPVRSEWGRMFLEHYQPADAAKLFEEALEIDENYAPAYLGMARVAAQRYDKIATEFANRALQHDPKLYQAHELLAYMPLEDSNPKAAADEANKALAISPEALDALAVLASIDWLDGKTESDWAARIWKVDPVYGEAYATGAHFFEINRRYEEAIRYERQALKLNNKLWSARSELGINLMRLGNETEARRELELCYAAHYRDAKTVNGLRLLDSMKDFETFTTPTTELVLNKKEAALLRPYIEPELQRAIATYEKKYRMKLPRPVRLEVYPNHEDFGVRTLGLPGIGGLLGVTFGTVVTMDSPSARPPGDFNWGSTMWHEISHVYVLTATHNLVPRWFTEGVSVHEEGAASRDWGDRLTPDIITAIQKKQLLPVLDLDRGFVHPQYPSQVLVSYFEAGKILDFISEKWGDNTILGMIHSYAAQKTTGDAIQENLHEAPDAFDKEFQAWLDQKTGNTVRHFDDWKKGMQAASSDWAKGDRNAALRQVTAIRDFYPDYVGNNSIYELIAESDLAKNDKAGAITVLEQYRDAGGTNVETLKKLARLEKEAGRSSQAETTLRKVNFVYPEDEEIHRLYGDVLLAKNDPNAAVREYRAALILQSSDNAESHYELARALVAANRVSEAKDQVLLALETAPGFKPAQQLLLQLSQ